MLENIIPPIKKCSKCGMEKPATVEHFYVQKQGKHGFRADCRECRNAATSARHHRNPEKANARSREWQSRNSDKVRARKRAYYSQNREKVLRQSSEWRARNPERNSISARAWREANRDKWSQYSREYYQEHKEQSKEKLQKWRDKNPDKVREYNSRRRVRILSAGGTFTAADVRLALRSQRGKCWHCSKPVGDDYHIDHLTPLAKGGTNWPNNIVISCAVCNLSKKDKLCQEWNGRLF